MGCIVDFGVRLRFIAYFEVLALCAADSCASFFGDGREVVLVSASCKLSLANRT